MHADNCVIYEFCLRDERGQHSTFVIEGWHWAQLVWDENQQLSSSSDHIIFLFSPLEMSFIASKKWEHNLCKETLFLFPVFDCSYVCKVCFLHVCGYTHLWRSVRTCVWRPEVDLKTHPQSPTLCTEEGQLSWPVFYRPLLLPWTSEWT